MELFIGVVIGFFISFFVIKRSILKTGYGQMRVCRETCPYFNKMKPTVDDNDDGDDDNDER